MLISGLNEVRLSVYRLLCSCLKRCLRNFSSFASCWTTLSLSIASGTPVPINQVRRASCQTLRIGLIQHCCALPSPVLHSRLKALQEKTHQAPSKMKTCCRNTVATHQNHCARKGVYFFVAPAMAPKKRPAAAVASKFGPAQSNETKPNPQFAPKHNGVNLQACHLIPVQATEEWIVKMEKTFGQTKKFWDKHHKDPENGIALPENIHKAFDASTGVEVAFLPDLKCKEAKKKNVLSKRFPVLHDSGSSISPLSIQAVVWPLVIC